MRIGMMSFAHSHANSYANKVNQLSDTQLVAIFDDNRERGLKAAETFNVDYYDSQHDFLKAQMDAVIICSENVYHKDMVVHAANAKKHILVEKPIATTVEDATEMIEACEKNDVILQVAFPVRFNYPIQQLKGMMDDGTLGEIIAIRTTNRGKNPGGWFIDEVLSGGGAVLDHTVHMVDIIRWFTGKEVCEVYGIVDSYFHNIDIDDAGILTLELEDGVVATHDASWSKCSTYPIWGDITIEVVGTSNIVRVDALKEHYRMYEDGDKPLKHIAFGNDMNYGLIKDFVECVKQNRKPSITGYDGLKALEVALAAYQSNKYNESVKI
ncbi:Gfo/Idh/MocA family protein [Gracilibacillus timonensis]|uniref:Gfo/Idh/MocA family protein n=1 Tax=Gracilibacillus timonensis TaxID=1816696 RepID=UPI0008248D07|nr:Gfo/Idh/MocA family oxidoreductase [Gracilibacillus timonensis]